MLFMEGIAQMKNPTQFLSMSQGAVGLPSAASCGTNKLDLFHICAFVAWMEISNETGKWPPDSELTRRRAYELYEKELKNGK